jgi:copper chaperone
MSEKTFKIEGMSCQHCVKAVEIELDELNLESYKVEVGSAKINYNEKKVSEAEIVKSIIEAGFKVK